MRSEISGEGAGSNMRAPVSLMVKLLAVIFVVAGLGIAIPGTSLLSLGGSAYYLVAGVVLVACGVLVWRGSKAGSWLYAAFMAGTLLWSLSESGLDGWALFPRVGLWLVLGIVLAFALAGGATTGSSRLLNRRNIVIGVVLLAAVGAGAICHANQTYGGTGPLGSSPSAQDAAAAEWAMTNGNSRSERFSALDQITPQNVGRLTVAWKTHLGRPEGWIGAIQATPLMVEDRLYTCNVNNEVVALDIDTGRFAWRFDPKVDRKTVPGMGACRGVAFYRIPNAQGLCAGRIIAFSHDARMFALDSRTGQRCPGFGNNGEVDMTYAMGVQHKLYYSLTSGPLIVRDKVILGGSVLDGQSTGEPSGVIRGFDVVTGKFAWAWDMARPSDHGLPAQGQTFTLGTPNAWPPMTGDPELGLAYIPLGNATPDYVSSHRTPIMNQYNSSLVALDVETGEPRWSFQTTHRDVWDYDIASPATLIDLPGANGGDKALIQPTKRGQFFVLDRRTGKPLVKTVELPVPQNPVPGETLSPTQPYPVGMPSFGGDRLTEASMWGLSPFDQLWCRIKFREARYDGDFTPISMTPTIVYPGYLGGSEWAGVAVDPDRHLMALNVNHFAMYNQMVTRAAAEKEHAKPFDVGSGEQFNLKIWPQAGTPYAARTSGFVSPLGTPCTQPPYSEIAVVDLMTRKTVWRKPLGTGRDTGPLGMSSMLPIPMGVPALGGPLVTRSGLVFIAATQERTFRAFDLNSGQLLWQDRLPAGGHAGPMSYFSKRTGRQYVVIPASGHPQMLNGQADVLVAYALPK
jgi:quinoprotein glucose dehydrogenase